MIAIPFSILIVCACLIYVFERSIQIEINKMELDAQINRNQDIEEIAKDVSELKKRVDHLSLKAGFKV